MQPSTLDHWATVQFFFSLAQVRCFWRCFCFRSGLVLFLKMSKRGDSWCTESSFSSLLVKLSQVFKSTLLDSILKLAVVPVACAHFYSISSFQSTLHLIYFDTALGEQPPQLHSVSMIVFWTTAKSAVFPIIVGIRHAPKFYCRDGHLMKLKCKYSNILKYWIFDFHALII